MAGVVKDFFPLHTLRRGNASYMSRRQFLLQHMNWASMFITPFNWSRRHLSALSYLRDYFGERIALYFNFLHSYVVEAATFSYLRLRASHCFGADLAHRPFHHWSGGRRRSLV